MPAILALIKLMLLPFTPKAAYLSRATMTLGSGFAPRAMEADTVYRFTPCSGCVVSRDFGGVQCRFEHGQESGGDYAPMRT